MLSASLWWQMLEVGGRQVVQVLRWKSCSVFNRCRQPRCHGASFFFLRALLWGPQPPRIAPGENKKIELYVRATMASLMLLFCWDIAMEFFGGPSWSVWREKEIWQAIDYPNIKFLSKWEMWWIDVCVKILQRWNGNERRLKLSHLAFLICFLAFLEISYLRFRI